MTLHHTRSPRARHLLTALFALVCVAVCLSATAPAQSAPAVNHDRIVSAVPGQTPAVNDGEVDAIVQVGDTVVVGGTFTSVTPVGGTAQAIKYIFAFKASTGALVSTFSPALNQSVNELIPGPTADSVYVGGAFTTVNGANTSHVTLLDTTTGAVSGGFKAAATNGVVYTMVKAGNRLIVGGSFTTAGGVAHAGLTSLDAAKGTLDGYINNQVSGHHNDSGSGAQGPVGVRDLDINADGSRLVAVGNFKKVDGLVRDQLVMLNLGASSSSVSADWATTRYSPYCIKSAFDTYVRGVSFSPDGSYFVVTATGGGFTGTLCDAASRFETNATGTDIQPTWIDYSGGDTLWAVTVTEKAVYVGGHQRWLNNSLASDRAGAGAVPRPGIAALNTKTGVPLKWNPGRNPRGSAVYALYATSQGLWMGSDTEGIGPHFTYKRPRIAFFPLVTGSPETSDATTGLPGNAFLGGNQSPATATTNDLRTATITSAGVQPASPFADGGVPWSTVRGAFLAGGRLYYGKSDNTFNYRPYGNSGTFGAEAKIDPYADPEWAGVDTGSGNTFDGKANTLYTQMSTVTGMAYSNGRLYYHLGTDSNLYWRWFNADSGVIGSAQFTANAGRNWSQTMGMFAADGKLYFATKNDGALNSIALTDAGPSGTSSVVNSPALGGTDWRARALFLAPTIVVPNKAPTADFTQSCSDLTCHFDSTSTDSDGTVSTTAWNFGDTGTGTGATIDHTFTGPGTYQVKLTVTDDDGDTGTKTIPVTVTSGSQSDPISWIGSRTLAANVAAPKVPVPDGIQAGDTLLLTGSLSLTTSADPGSGWTVVGDQKNSSQLRAMVWVHTVTTDDVAAGLKSVTVTLDAAHKTALEISAYRGLNATTPVVSATARSDAGTATHTAPDVTVPGGSWVVSFWAEKGSNTKWTPAVGSLRAEVYSTSTGAVSSATADSGGAQAGSVPGSTATSSVASTYGLNWSIVLAPQ